MTAEIKVIDPNNLQSAINKPVIIEKHITPEVGSEAKKVIESSISFSKPTIDISPTLAKTLETATTSGDTSDDTSDEESKDPNVRRAQRREAFKRASDIEKRAMAMEKAAKEKLAKTQHFEKLMQNADTDPVELAKALGKDPNDFLRKLQNSMFNIKEEPVEKKPELTAEHELQNRLDKLEKEREAEKIANAKYAQENQINSYIATKILPTVHNLEKYPLLNSDGDPAQAAQFVYAIMNQYYQEHGEELDAESVAQHIEDGLYAQAEEKLNSIRKISKFSKYFKDEIAEPTAPLGVSSSRKAVPRTLSDSMISVPSTAAPIVSARPRPETRQEKLARLDRKYAGKL
jgi:hypothetical protein